MSIYDRPLTLEARMSAGSELIESAAALVPDRQGVALGLVCKGFQF